jgi:hypothetical protein
MFQTAMKMREFLVVLVAVLVQLPHSPLVRLVILVEAGTHLIFDALMCPYRIGERVRALKLLRSVTNTDVVDVGQGFTFLRNGTSNSV